MQAFCDRRLNLCDMLPGIPALLYSGRVHPRNYPDNGYPFRASSHYLYFGGPPRPDAGLVLINGEGHLFMDLPGFEDEIWHGAGETAEDLKAKYSLDSLRPLAELGDYLDTFGREEVLTLPLPDAEVNRWLAEMLGREPDVDGDFDSDLAQAVVELRLRNDEAAVDELRQAADLTVAAHLQAMQACRAGLGEAEVLAELVGSVTRARGTYSFQPIVSTRGEVLHNHCYDNKLSEGDLLLIDFGAESPNGWAGDVTRTIPVSGKYSASQKTLYQTVLAAQKAAIEMLAPGVEFAEAHKHASRVLCAGLVEAGLLTGNPEELVERGAHALFFPHGLGHLVGLDVHDMEDLGDLAGYGERERSSQFGLSYLRLDRELEPGMLVTVEPGYYRIPALLNDSERTAPFKDCLNLDRLEDFADVRGIRIEDEVLITDDGYEVLTAELPKEIAEIEALMAAG